VTVKTVTFSTEHGAPSIKADTECVERSLVIDKSTDLYIMKQGVSNTSMTTTTLRPYRVNGETLDVKGHQTGSLGLGGRKFHHRF